MKLRTKFILAFVSLTFVSLCITILISFPSVLRIFSYDQRQQLRSKTLSWIVPIADNGINDKEWSTLVVHAQDSGCEVYLVTPAGTVTRSSIPGSKIPYVVSEIKQYGSSLTAMDTQYLVSVKIPVYTSKALFYVLVTTPLNIWDVSRDLAVALGKVVVVGLVISILFSILFSRTMTKPLLQLKRELQKVEALRFQEVISVKATGEIGEVAESVYRMSKELSLYIQTQRRFFQNGSHELKTPLMSIRGYAEAIRDKVLIGEDAQQGLDVIVKESDRLKKVVMDMILLAKLESQDDVFDRHVINVKHTICEAMNRIKPLFEHQGIKDLFQFSMNRSLLIRGDEDKLLQALLNVMSNAIRYARTRVSVTVHASQSHLRLEIQDDGSGFSVELLPHVFQRFVKGKDGETGLGLAISRAIVVQCGGEIGAYNHPHGGAVVWMTFPRLAEKEITE